ncbi:MAG: hypothetical protein GXY36_11290 [Chloroflexi bacterium]|nr:hypothetical protein [Chloroflexota bacterium]
MSRRQRTLLALVVLVGLAFALRIYRLDTMPLRGDEAFAVRDWAAPPDQTVRDLARHEPHPLGTFLGFWAWKQAAGSSEFAMRYLPLLGNLLGVPVMLALGWRVFRGERTAGLAALLWAVHPFLIWHAQDVRNYALWAAFSPLAIWLLLRAADTNRPRDWALYVLAAALAAYTFFLEAFLLPVHALYLLAFRRTRPVLRRALLAWVALAILLIPWLVQVYYLSQSGYEGTLGAAEPARLLTWFLPVLLLGEEPPAPWNVIAPLAWIALIGIALWARTRRVRRRALWLAAWIVLPAALLLIAATRMSVFHPRYLIAIIPALLLLTARAALPPLGTQPHTRPGWAIAPSALLLLPILSLGLLPGYYGGANPKSPDWRTLAAYLDARVQSRDLIIQTAADPALPYYVHSAPEASLVPDASASAQLAPALNNFDGIWLIGRAAEAERHLERRWQKLSQHTVAGFEVAQFRPWEIEPGEIASEADVTFGDFAHLRGYTVQGPDAATGAITVLLYWEPLAQAGVDYKVFVHLLGPPRPADGNPLWAQDDHRPQHGFASTLSWQPGVLLRDPYNLVAGDHLEPGEYTLAAGFYHPDTGERIPAAGPGGVPVESVPLLSFTWPLDE